MQIYQDYIHLSKYSRFIDAKNRRETWEETVDRYISFWKGKYPDAELPWDEMKSSIYKYCAMPSMRALMTAGKALDRDNIAGFNCSATGVYTPRVFDEIFYMLMCGTGVGFDVRRKYVKQMPEINDEFYPTDTTIIVEDSKIGWAKAFKELIAMLYTGNVPSWDLAKVRPAGERLKTFGGRSSGPLPLDKLFRYTVNLFKNAAGRKLTTLECHDLICQIAMTVIVGSVRRSATISFSNLSDDRIRRAKMGDWFNSHPERALANNSVMYTCKPDLVSYLNEFLSLYESKSGERGICNQEALKKKAESCGREYDGDYLLNPCITGDSRILTDKGYYPIEQLVGKTVSVWNGNEFSEVIPFSTGINPLMMINFSNGVSFKVTPYHKFIMRNGDRVEAKDLLIGDKLKNFDMPKIDIDSCFDPDIDAYSQGFYSGDGETNGTRSKIYFTKYDCTKRLKGTIHDYRSGSYVTWIHGEMLEKTYVPMNASIKFKLNWLAGLLDSDGNIMRNPNSIGLSISSVDWQFLYDIRLMLTAMGVRATLANEHNGGIKNMPDGKGGLKEYMCKPTFRILITSTDTKSLIDSGLVCNRLDLSDCNPNRDDRRYVVVTSAEYLDYGDETFCVTEPLNNSFTVEGIVTGNCGEAILRDTGGLCNLSEIVARTDDTLPELIEKTKIATIFGTLQSSLTKFRYLRKVWKDNAESDPLLGVSITGIMDNPVLNGKSGFDKTIEWISVMKEVARETNNKYADMLGIKRASQITLIKPSGTVSQLVNCSSGIHPRHSKYILRKVAQDIKDPLSQLMVDQKIPHYKDGEKYYFKFPIEVPENSLCIKDIDAIYQLELWSIYQKHWCDGNPSQTIYYNDNNFPAVQQWVWEHWDDIGGLSFFPKDNNVYINAPYTDITKEEYDKLLAEFPSNIDFSLLRDYESGDCTTGSQELACSGAGGCEL